MIRSKKPKTSIARSIATERNLVETQIPTLTSCVAKTSINQISIYTINEQKCKSHNSLRKLLNQRKQSKQLDQNTKMELAETYEIGKVLSDMENPFHQQNNNQAADRPINKQHEPSSLSKINRFCIPKIKKKRKRQQMNLITGRDSTLTTTIDFLKSQTYRLSLEQKAIQQRNNILKSSNHSGCVRLYPWDSKDRLDKSRRALAKFSNDHSKEISLALLRQQLKTTQGWTSNWTSTNVFDYNGNSLPLNNKGHNVDKKGFEFIATRMKVKTKEQLKKFGYCRESKLNLTDLSYQREDRQLLMRAINTEVSRDAIQLLDTEQLAKSTRKILGMEVKLRYVTDY